MSNSVEVTQGGAQLRIRLRYRESRIFESLLATSSGCFYRVASRVEEYEKYRLIMRADTKTAKRLHAANLLLWEVVHMMSQKKMMTRVLLEN